MPKVGRAVVVVLMVTQSVFQAAPCLANASTGRWASMIVDQYGAPQISCTDDVALSAIRVTKSGGSWSGSNVIYAQAASTGICKAGPAIYIGTTTGISDGEDCPPHVFELILPLITNTSTLSYAVADRTCSPCPCTHFYYGGSVAGTSSGGLWMAYLDDAIGNHQAFVSSADVFAGPYSVTALGGARDDLSNYWTATAIGSDGNPRVVYTATDGPVVCARFNGVGWTQTTITGSALPSGYIGSRPAIAMDYSGRTHIAFIVNGSSLWSATETSGASNVFAEPVEVAASVSLAPGISAGAPGVVYIGYGQTAGGQLHNIRLTTDNAGALSDELIETHALPTDLDGTRVATAYSGGVVRVAYPGNDSDGGLVLWYASRASGAWAVEQAWPQPPAPPPPPPGGGGHGGHGGDDTDCGCGLKQVASDGGFVPKDFWIGAIDGGSQRELRLYVAAPYSAVMSLELVDITGRRARELRVGRVMSGRSTLVWNVDGVPKGVYVVSGRVEGNIVSTCKVVVR